MTHTPDNAAPIHAPMTQFSVNGAHLMAGGQRITDIADQMKDRAFYIYDRGVMRDQINQLRTAMPPSLRIHYAIKANPMPEIVSYMSGLVDGLDVASEREMGVALSTGMRPDHISFAGPGKRDSEIESAVRAGIILNVESEREITTAVQAGRSTGTRPKIAVRINPDFELKGSGMRMGGGAKQFGIDVERAPDILKSMNTTNIDFYGLHIFSGSNSLSAPAIIEAQEKTLALARHLARFAPGPFRKINIGGGFGIPYFPGEKHLDISAIGAALAPVLSQFEKDFAGTQVNIELGRYLVGPSGLYVARIVDRKISRGQVFLVTNGGMHHHLAASGNFGQSIRKNYPVVIANRMDQTRADQIEVASVVGPLCTPLDLLADKMTLPRGDVGDLVAVYQSGAYGLTASPREFLSHPDAAEVVV